MVDETEYEEDDDDREAVEAAAEVNLFIMPKGPGAVCTGEIKKLLNNNTMLHTDRI